MSNDYSHKSILNFTATSAIFCADCFKLSILNQLKSGTYFKYNGCRCPCSDRDLTIKVHIKIEGDVRHVKLTNDERRYFIRYWTK